MSLRTQGGSAWRRILRLRRKWFARQLGQLVAKPRPRLMIESLESRRVLATLTWDGGGGDLFWLNANNWDTNTVPTNADDVIIPDLVGTPVITIGSNANALSVTSAERIQIQAGTTTVLNSSSFALGLDINGATYSTNGTTSLSGTSQWGGATISGTGTVQNNGTINFYGGTITISSGASVSNAGTFSHVSANTVTVTGGFTNEVGANYNITAASGGLNAFASSVGVVNLGTISRSAGAGAFNFNASIVGTPTIRNAGTVNLATGTATWQGAENVTHTGTFNLSSGTTMTFSNGTSSFGTGSTIIGGGTAQFNAGTFNVTGDSTFASSVNFAGGTFSVSATKTLTVTGTVALASGALNGTGAAVFTGTVNVAGTSTTSLGISSLAFNGVTNHTGTAAVSVSGNLTLGPTSQYLITTNSGGLNPAGGASSSITNFGLIRRSSGTGNFSFNITVAGTPALGNEGTVELQTGTATWQGAATKSHKGNFALSAGTTLTFSGGGSVFDTGSSITGSGTVVFNGGTYSVSDNVTFSSPTTFTSATINVAASKTLTLPGTTSVDGGQLGGAGSVVISGTMVIGTSSFTLGAASHTVTGTISHGGTGTLTATGALTIAVGGTYLITANTGALNATGVSAVIVNQGTFSRTAGSGAFSVAATSAGTPTPVNTATVNIQTGTVNWSGNTDATHTGTFTVSSGASLAFGTGTQTLGNGVVISGAGTTVFNSGAVNTAGTVTISTPVTLNSGTLTATNNSTLVLTGTSTWTGSTLASSGTGKIRNVGTLNVSSALVIQSGTVENSGTISIGSTNAISMLGSAVLNNLVGATITIGSTNGTPFQNATGTINNSGVFRKTSTGSGSVQPIFNNTGGTIELQNGSIAISNALGTVQSGVFNLSAGTELLYNQNSTWSGTLSGSGTGNITWNAGIQTIAAGGLSVNTPSSMLRATITSVGGTGTMTIASGSGFNVAVPGGNTFTVNAPVVVQGLWNRAGAGVMNINSTGSILIQTGGVFDINLPASGTAASFAGSPGPLTNSGGTIRKLNANTATLNVPVSITSGTLDNQAGVLNISRAGNSFSGTTFTIATATEVVVNADTTWSGSTTVTGTGNLSWTAGTHTISPSGMTLTSTGSSTRVLGSTVLSGTGTLIVRNDSQLNVTVGSGNTVVFNAPIQVAGRVQHSGAGTIQLNAAGSLTVASGGILDLAMSSSGTAFNFSGSPGTITVQSGGELYKQQANSQTVNVIVNNSGTVNVDAGTLVLSNAVAQASTSTLTGGSWRFVGTLDISSAPSITTIGAAATVTYAASTASFPKVATVNNIQGALILLNKNFLGSASGPVVSTGSVTVTGGSYSQTTATAFTQNGGTTVLDSGAVFNANVTLNSGTFGGGGTVVGTTFNNVAGTIAQSGVAKILNITGNLVQGAGGTMEIEVGGVSAAVPDFDQLLVSGSATLAGTINVSLVNGFVPDKSQTFRFMTMGSRSGDFSTISLPQVNGRTVLATDVGSTFYDLLGNTLVVRNLNDSGAFSLRDRLATASLSSDTDVILFDVGGTIQLTSPLPPITQPVSIDGRTIPGYTTTPLLELRGDSAGVSANGLTFSTGSSGSSVYGVAINGFTGTGIELGVGGITVSSNHVGTNTAGDTDLGNAGNGIAILSGADGNLIVNNLVSGNEGTGILVQSDNNKIQGNRIGTDTAGTVDLGNSLSGVWIYGGSGNIVGVDGDGVGDASEKNLISGNSTYGVYFQGNSNNNLVAGNFIGTNQAGDASLGNSSGGISFFNDGLSNNNRIGTNANGTSDTLERNVISGNSNYGVVSFAPSTVIAGNYIGVNAAGTAGLDNAQGGISIAAAGNRVGGTNLAERNVIGGNNAFGIQISAGGAGTQILGNLIGLDATGATSLGTSGTGIAIEDVGGVTVGGGAAGARNVISGLTRGVVISGPSASGNSIYGNYVGTDITGLLDRGNSSEGIRVHNGANSNFIGGAGAGQGNLVSGNNEAGITILSAASQNNIIAGNVVGLGSDGTTVIPNNGGVAINETNGTTLGGLTTGHRNVISGNGFDGVTVNFGATNTLIQGNYIGLDTSGTLAKPNDISGVIVANGATNNTIGGSVSGARNIISGTHFSGGVVLLGVSDNVVLGNYLGTNATGTAAIASSYGVRIFQGSTNNVIGGSNALSRNVISGNVIGIDIADTGTSGNRVSGNYIGMNPAGSSAIPNTTGIRISANANSNIIGTNNDGNEDANEGNWISGNTNGTGTGIEVSGASSNVIAGNRIGTNAGITGALPNRFGILLAAGATNTTIGGASSVSQNIISGNNGIGIRIQEPTTTGNVVLGNILGMNQAGTTAIPNGTWGIIVDGAPNTTIGGPASSKNLVSGNTQGGIAIVGSTATGTLIEGNWIGTDGTGTLDRGNQFAGIFLGSAESFVGMTSTGSASQGTVRSNLVSGNNLFGVQILGVGSDQHVVVGNLIGTDWTGTSTIGNSGDGIRIGGGASNNTIGGVGASNRNIISGNIGDGIEVNGATSNNNVITGNYIGIDINGTSNIAGSIAWWKAEGASTDTVDGSTATAQGGAAFATGLVGQAFNFDGVNDYQDVPHQPNHALTSAVTMEAWINPTTFSSTGSGPLILSKSTSYVLQLTTAGQLRISLPGIGTLTSTSTLSTGAWTHVAGTYSVTSGVLSLYINGVLDSTTTGSGGNLAAASGNLTIGGSSTGQYFTGRIDEPAVFERALNSTEVQSIYAAGALGKGLGNTANGIRVQSALNTRIGGTVSGEGNVISGNNDTTLATAGILATTSANGLIVQGNIVGLDATGTQRIANSGLAGVSVSGSSNTQVGGTTSTARNILSGNRVLGLIVQGVGSNNVVEGNYIGLAADGDTAIGNSSDGLRIVTVTGTRIGGTIAGARNVIAGNKFDGIDIRSAATGTVILGNYVGTNAAGTLARPNAFGGNLAAGIWINTVSNVTIGGTVAGAGNLVSGNLGDGIYLNGTGVSNVIVQGNLVGTAANGQSALPNSATGIRVDSGAASNTIGGSATNAGNIISGNSTDGIWIDGTGTSFNLIRGNTIGLNIDGTTAIGNGANGVLITSSANSNTIGGSTAGDRNVISGQTNTASFTGNGVLLRAVSNTLVAGNYIGLDKSGVAAVPNRFGVYLRDNATNTIIGTNADGNGDSGERNVIAGNSLSNVVLEGVSANRISGNYLGSNAAGTTGFLTSSASLSIQASGQSNIVGYSGTGDAAVQKNLFLRKGVEIRDAGSSLNRVAGNTFGIANDNSIWAFGDAVSVLLSATNNIVGTNADGQGDANEGNVIAGYTDGVALRNSGVTGNVVAGNRIGTNASGTSALPNSVGVLIANGASNNTIGGTVSAARNILSGNTQFGVHVNDSNSNGNVILGNYIGTDLSGTQDLGNGVSGIRVNGIGNTVGGAVAGSGNVVSGNDSYGIELLADGNFVYGNLVGTNASGTAAIGNEYTGITVQSSDNIIGGSTAAERNVISGTKRMDVFGSGDTGAGLSVYDAGFKLVTGNLVQGNYIGTDITGSYAISNYRAGLAIVLGVPDNENFIGGDGPGQGNVISGNGTGAELTAAGIYINGNADSYSTIVGNRIGTNSLGTVAVPNLGFGVYVYASNGHQIGGSSEYVNGRLDGMGNLISGNLRDGINLNSGGGNVDDIDILGNFIGTDITGNFAIPNGGAGVVSGGARSRIGGVGDLGNLISGNSHGVIVNGGSDSKVQNNRIGTNYLGSETIGNTNYGVWVSGTAQTTTIGGTGVGEGNVVSGNSRGIHINLATTAGTLVQGNFIGTDLTGTLDLGNTLYGISIDQAAQTTIGGTISAARNVISGNTTAGIHIQGPNASDNLILGNFVGTDVSGVLALANGIGVDFDSASTGSVQGNTIGGTAAGAGNLIAGNTGAGIRFSGAATSSNAILGNMIGTNTAGSSVLGNDQGIWFDAGAQNNTIGGVDATAGNLIGGNRSEGIRISGIDSDGNTIQGNWIGTDRLRTQSISNLIGIQLTDGVQAQVGGAVIGAGNVLANNRQAGLRLATTSANSGSFGNNVYFGNIGLPIDVAGDGVTANDSGDGDGVLNAPVITGAAIDGGNLVVEGIVGAGRGIELYVSSATFNGFGSGEQLLGTFVEGAINDEAAGTQSYGPSVRGVVVGSDTANRFKFTVPLPSGVQFGSVLTALALGSTSEFSSTITVGNVASNLPPVISLPSTTLINVGDLLRITGSFVDEDSTNWTATVDYGDGSGFEPLALRADRTFVLEHTYTDTSNSPFTIQVRIVDNGGEAAFQTSVVQVQGTGPVVQFNEFSITSIVNEGNLVTLTGNFTDPSLSSEHYVTIEWGDGVTSEQVVPPGQRSFVATHVYRDDGLAGTATSQDFYRVSISVRDGNNQQDTTPNGLYIVEVDNVRPSNLLLSGVAASVDEGQSFVLNGSFFDPGVLDTHLVTVDWGDGSEIQEISISAPPAFASLTRAFSLPHAYRDNPESPVSSYTITVSVVDDDDPARPTVATRSVVVNNVAPTIDSAFITPAVIGEGGTASLSLAFSDRGVADEHEVEINWGDGSAPETFVLQAGVNGLTNVTHSYLNNRPGDAGIPVTIRVRDKDMPTGVFTTTSQIIQVSNQAPTVSNLLLFRRDALGAWLPVPFGISVPENTELRISGTYFDAGALDKVQVQVSWAAGQSVLANLDPELHTFDSRFVITDDFGLGSAIDELEVVVTATDTDGAFGSTTNLISVHNVAPVVNVIPGKVDPSRPWEIPLLSDVVEPSLQDRAALNYFWRAEGTGVQIGTNQNFILDRNVVGMGLVKLTLQVTDDDGGLGFIESAMLFGTINSETIPINNSTFVSADTHTLLVVSLGGEDVIDGSQVTNPDFRLVLDGGDQDDKLFGGAGDDIYILRSGNDSANVPTASVTIANDLGNDRYLLVPNSVLSVIDNTGANALDFSLADFSVASLPDLGVTFDLSEVNSTSLVPQDVAEGSAVSGLHYVAAQGVFTDLIGSRFNDTLTTTSLANVKAGAGADKLIVGNDTQGGRLSGGADADIFVVEGTNIGGVSFEGDTGADEFSISFGSELSGVSFRGGADNDLFELGDSLLAGVSFEGDAGADVFEIGFASELSAIVFRGGADADVFRVDSGALSEISFEGDSGADVFEINTSLTLTGISFEGGADNDLFDIAENTTLTGISFEGDAGSDEFEIGVGTSLSGIVFSGGADNDLLTLDSVGALSSVSFEGDSGADELVTLGTSIGTIEFLGGADNDLFTVTENSSIGGISFEGDLGADDLVIEGTINGGIFFGGGADDDLFDVSGSVLGDIVFSGGADDDLLTVSGSLGSLSFEGDIGADELVITGTLDNIDFLGGADDDLLSIEGTVLGAIAFEGGADNDLLEVGDTVLASIEFNGGADSDLLVIEGTVGGISFEGDAGADEFQVFGTVGTIDFNGGADDDLLVVSGEALGGISFEGDIGADEFEVVGTVNSIEFSGGADNDLLSVTGTALGTIAFAGGDNDDLFTVSGSLAQISFEGDDGADLLVTEGVINQIDFSGGADSDRLINRASNVQAIRFHGLGLGGTGTDDKDFFFNSGSHISEISFEGDDGADVFVTVGSSIGSIDFQGDSGADLFVIDANSIGAISFEGGADSDVLAVSGTEISSISFEGDGGLGSGDDTFVNRSKGRVDSAGNRVGTIEFRGGMGIDAFRNDGTNWKVVTFIGGADNDVLQNNGTELEAISFEGDAGADVFENNATGLATIEFFGGADSDVFANDASSLSSIVFLGGADDDLLINSGSEVSGVSFEGDTGDDILVNSGVNISGISFEGDAGNDRLFNSGAGSSGITFYGGQGSDLFHNRATAVGSSHLRMLATGSFPTPALTPLGSLIASLDLSDPVMSDDGADIFVNEASEVSDIFFGGGADDDVFQNDGLSVSGISFEGDEGDDQFLNLGADLADLLFVGGSGKDVLENRGDRAGAIVFQGGTGSDELFQRGSDVLSIRLEGGADEDSLANWGDRAQLITMLGGTEDDRLQNNAKGVVHIVFEGNEGNDALQNNGDLIQEIEMFGGDGADTLFNNGSEVVFVSFDGGEGADTLINSGSRIGLDLPTNPLRNGLLFVGGTEADLLRTSGTGVVQTQFLGDAGDDALLFNAQGTNVSFYGGDGDDVITFRGSVQTLDFHGDDGEDRVMFSGATALGLGGATASLRGGDGSDSYEIAGTPRGWLLIDEPIESSSDTSRDRLDFSSYTGGSIQFDMASTAPQSLATNLTLQLTGLATNAIEDFVGTRGSDAVFGNDRDNALAGAEFYTRILPQPLAKDRETQWVLLDFDSATDGREHFYALEERTEIQRRIEGVYYGLNTDGSPRAYTDPDRWFNVRFTQNLSDIPPSVAFATIVFNETPSFGRPGGESSEIDPSNLGLGGRAVVQVNGLLGGIEVAPTGDFMSQIPEDGEQTYGNAKPPATVENFVALSAKIAAHELAHLLGLRHYDAFGPIGFGIHSPPGVAEFKPTYQGTSAAFETFDHIIGSPASVGSTRANDIGQLFFGEREAIKLTYGMSSPSMTNPTEASIGTNNNTLNTALPLVMHTLQVPNTLGRGINAEKAFYVQAAGVIGSIDLDSSGRSQSDFYRFTGFRGDLVTIEVGSQAIRRYLDLGLDGNIDAVVTLRHADGRIVQFFGRDAISDDEFESSDALLMDVELPETGDYVIEVDTFTRGPRDSDPDPDSLSIEGRQLLEDILTDTDVGSYQLFVYNFNKANSTNATDVLVGRGGADVIELGANTPSTPEFLPYQSNWTLYEGAEFVMNLGFADVGGSAWTATVDYGDGSAPVVFSVTPTTGVNLSRIYVDNGLRTISVTVVNDDGKAIQGTLSLTVENRAPVPTITSISTPLQEGRAITIGGQVVDAGANDAPTLNWIIAKIVGATSETYASGSGSVFEFIPNDNGDYRIELSGTDKDNATAVVTQTISVANLPPIPAIDQVSLPRQEGAPIQVFGSSTDPGALDLPVLSWTAYKVVGSSATSYATGTGVNWSFVPDDDGIYRIELKAVDKDLAEAMVSQDIVVANVAPLASILSISTPRQEGTAISINGAVADVGVLDAPTLSWRVYRQGVSTSTVYASGNGAVFTFVPNDNDTYRVELTARDKDNATHVVTEDVLVANLPPVPVISTLSSPLQEGTAVTLSGSVSDPGANDVPSLAWSIAAAATPSIIVASGTGPTIQFIPEDNDTYTATLTSLDKDGQSAVTTRSFVVGNVAPTASLSLNVPASILINTLVTATLSASDVAGAKDPLSYSWQITRDGVSIGSQTGGTTYTFTPTIAGAYVIVATVNDGDGGIVTTQVSISATNPSTGNTPPTVSILKPEDGVMNESSYFMLIASDVDAADLSGQFTYNVNWGDGTSTTVTGPRVMLVSKTYSSVSSDGDFSITASAKNVGGSYGPTKSVDFIVVGWTLMADPIAANRAILAVVGSEGRDDIKIKSKDDDYLVVTIRDRDCHIRRRGTVYGDVDRILVFAHSGNDKVEIDDDIHLPAEIWGGAGDDDIKGGDGDDIILGESGNDNLWGGDGRDIVIGGFGADRIHGDAKDDILVAGFVSYEADFNRLAPSSFGSSTRLTFEDQRRALEAIMAEWGSNRSYTQRRLNILGQGTSTRANGTYYFRIDNNSMLNNTVFDDDAVDRLWGDDGTDWFFANTTKDRGGVLDEIKDRKGSELAEDIDKWW